MGSLRLFSAAPSRAAPLPLTGTPVEAPGEKASTSANLGCTDPGDPAELDDTLELAPGETGPVEEVTETADGLLGVEVQSPR